MSRMTAGASTDEVRADDAAVNTTVDTVVNDAVSDRDLIAEQRRAVVTASDRLARVRATALLDTPAEQAFDRLTRIASKVLEVPTALVSLVDGDRDFWKSCIGVPEPFASAREIRLTPSFCQHAIMSAAPLVVNDATLDPIFADFPAVKGIGVRAYLGIPLITSDGVALGSFCVLDTQPRVWTPEQIELLRDLSGAVMTEIELRAAVTAAEEMTSQLHEQARELEHQAAELEQQVEESQVISEELEEANEQLTEAALALEARTNEAENANRAKSDFLASMSHELRTPLNAIGGYVELIEMGLRGPVTPEQLSDLARIQRSQKHLLGLINDVLNFAKLSAGQVEYHTESVPLNAALCDAESMILPQLRSKRLEYSYEACDESLLALADNDKLQQIVLNLLSNAVKFTHEGGSITVSCADDGEFVRVRVHDTGIGVPAEKLDSIFEPFVQVERRLSHPAIGAGLGLAISRDLALGMGGDLTAESTSAGSTFTLTLPRAG